MHRSKERWQPTLTFGSQVRRYVRSAQSRHLAPQQTAPFVDQLAAQANSVGESTINPD
jgi:hypothetical protein